MPDLDKHITIPKNVATKDDLDFSFLKEKGLEHIEQLASNLWTDYNEHDPGITILEMLCYAITDLGSRVNLPLENILAPENEEAKTIEEQFFKATQILPSKPVTELDYRKLFVDIEGVKNCWIKPFDKTVYVDCKNDKLAYDPKKLENNSKNFKLQGLNALTVDFDDLREDDFPTKEEKDVEYDRIKKEIRTLYHKNRNLCEDLIDISKVEVHPISVCASIDVAPDADEELIHAKIIRAIDNYFSPSVKFYSLQQMFDKGYTSDEIFEGPVLKNGFIDPEELQAAGLRTEVRLSDIMQLIMNIEGVNVVKEISIADCNNPGENPDVWVICVEPGKKPVRCKDSAYSYYKGLLPVNINKKRVNEYLAELESEEEAEQANARADREIEVPTGNYLNTDETTTIQNDFPDTYGIGKNGLPSRVSTIRKSQAKQLKGYLLFFDQILATYFAHLGKVKDLLSVDSKLKQTYFTQAVKDIKGFEELVNDYDTDDNENLTAKILSKLDNNIERKNILLDHLIARFAEKFSDYAFLMKQLYGTYAERAILESKETFLSEYGEITDKNGKIINKGISNWRGSAFNYFDQKPEDLWDTTNVAGVQKRIARLAGIKDYSRRNLADTFTEVHDLVVDSEGNKVYRWNIRNRANKIILTTSKDFKSRSRAATEMYKTVVRVTETPESAIEEAFKKPLSNKQEIGNFIVHVFPGTSLMFSIIDPELPEGNPKRIIARHINIYSSPGQLKKAMLTVLKFITTDFIEEGMYVVEHNLLRPLFPDELLPETEITDDLFMPICTDNCTSCQPIDPYSFRLTVVLPGWTYRFSNPDFRNFLEQLIRKELPAHILARICWVGNPKNEVIDDGNDMLVFQEKWHEFLMQKTIPKPGTEDEQINFNKALKELIKILNELNSIYSSGRLIDCDDEDDPLEGRVILGRTNIGNL